MSNAARELTTTIEGNAVTMTDKPASEGAAMLSMIERAARDPNVDVDKFERLMLMKERVEKEAARKAFNVAIANAKAEMPQIVRNAEGHNKMRYADFSAIARSIDHILAKHGLSYRFRTNQPDKATISVTCIISHTGGYCEENTLSGGPDKSGAKNDIQAVGSTLQYLQRYSLVGAMGLATTKDDDGQAAGASDAADLRAEGERIARDEGAVALGDWWTRKLTKEERTALGGSVLADLKKIAGA